MKTIMKKNVLNTSHFHVFYKLLKTNTHVHYTSQEAN